MSDIIDVLGTTVDGLLGINALSGMIGEINFNKQKIDFYTDTSLLKTEGFHKVSYTYQSKHQKTPVILCSINGVEFELTLDTGYHGMLFLNSTELYNNLGSSIINKGKTSRITAGAKFEIEESQATINSIDFKSFTINQNIDIDITKSNSNEGVFGIQFLREFFSEVIIDPLNKEIYFKLSQTK